MENTENAENALVLLYDLCRLCLDDPGVDNIFKPVDWSQDILIYTGIKVTTADKFPQTICSSCRDIISSIKVLKDIAITNERRLRRISGLGDKNQNNLRDDPGNFRNRIVFEAEEESASLSQTEKKRGQKRKSSSTSEKNSSAPKSISVRKDLIDPSAAMASSSTEKRKKTPTTTSGKEPTKTVTFGGNAIQIHEYDFKCEYATINLDEDCTDTTTNESAEEVSQERSITYHPSTSQSTGTCPSNDGEHTPEFATSSQTIKLSRSQYQKRKNVIIVAKKLMEQRTEKLDEYHHFALMIACNIRKIENTDDRQKLMITIHNVTHKFNTKIKQRNTAQSSRYLILPSSIQSIANDKNQNNAVIPQAVQQSDADKTTETMSATPQVSNKTSQCILDISKESIKINRFTVQSPSRSLLIHPVQKKAIPKLPIKPFKAYMNDLAKKAYYSLDDYIND